MTVTTTTNRNDYVASGIAGPYAYNFRIFAATDLVVETLVGGVITQLAYPAQYTVSGVGNIVGGSIQLSAVLAAGSLIIRRVVGLQQTTSLRAQSGRFDPAVHEDTFDKLMMIDQQHQDELDRCIKLAEVYNPAGRPVAVSPTAGHVLIGNGLGFITAPLDTLGNVALPGNGRTTVLLTEYLLNDALFNVLDYRAGVAITTGVNDARAAFLLTAAAAGPTSAVYVPPGTYRIASNMSLNSPVFMMPGAVFKPDAGVTITFNNTFTAPLARVFDCAAASSRIILVQGTVVEVYPTWWGAVGDGVTVNQHIPIQAAVDCVIYGGTHCRVKLISGKYLLGNTVNLGYGHTFGSVVLEGDIYMYRGGEVVPHISGCILIATAFSDRPAVAINGARGTRLRRIGLYGALYTWIYNRLDMGYGHGTGPLSDDTLAASWQDPALAATQESRYAPYAGVAIDGYTGVRPGTSYPDQPLPGWIGAIGQYNRGASSDVKLEDVYIIGFNTAVVNQPGDYDGNGDFTMLDHVYMEYNKWGVSVGNGQARNTSMLDCKASHMYCVMVNNIHGKQIGKFSGLVKDLSMWGVNQMIQFSTFYAEPIKFLQCYSEAMWKIGSLDALATTESSIIFDCCEFSFSNQTDARGYPAYVLEGGQQQIDVVFKSCIFNIYNAASVVGLYQFGVQLDGCYIRRDVAHTNLYEMFAHNALAGGFVLPQLLNADRARIKVLGYNLDTSTRFASAQYTGIYGRRTSRQSCLPIYTEQVIPALDQYDSELGRPPRPYFAAVAKSSLTTCTLVGSTLTVTFAARTTAQFAIGGPDCGDVIWDDQSGSTFWVRSRTGTTILCDFRSNYKVVAGVRTPIVAFNAASGVLWWCNSRLYTPSYYTHADFTAASNILTNAMRGDGFAGHLTAEIIANDWLYAEEQRDLPLPASQHQITNVNAGAFTITVVGNVTAGHTQVRRRLKWFARTPPANFP